MEKKETNTAFSADQENYSCSTLAEAVEEAVQQLGLSNEEMQAGEYIGEEVVVSEGEKIECKASSFVLHISDDLKEAACDECGEYADCWDWSKEDEAKLNEAVKAAIDKWADETNNQPTFWNIGRVRDITCKITGQTQGDFEVVRKDEWIGH